MIGKANEKLIEAKDLGDLLSKIKPLYCLPRYLYAWGMFRPSVLRYYCGSPKMCGVTSSV
jgi:hypothetical protein